MYEEMNQYKHLPPKEFDAKLMELVRRELEKQAPKATAKKAATKPAAKEKK